MTSLPFNQGAWDQLMTETVHYKDEQYMQVCLGYARGEKN